MKKVEVLYYAGCTEGLWAKIRMDEEEEEEIITIPMSNEDINEYIGRHYPEEKATLREAEQDDWEDERRANEEYIEKDKRCVPNARGRNRSPFHDKVHQGRVRERRKYRFYFL